MVDHHNSEPSGTAISGSATGDKGVGVRGSGKATGVRGIGETWHGVAGVSSSSTGGYGVYGRNDSGGTGVAGESEKWVGVYGSSKGHAGVMGEGKPGTGVIGRSANWVGVYGETQAPATAGAAGVWADGKEGGYGVKGHASAQGAAGVAGYHLTRRGPGVYGEGAPAGYFKGDVVVTGDLILEGADYAEALTVADPLVTAGMVVVLDDEGRIRPCTHDYDPRVAGVVSGAGGIRPALVLDRHDGGAPVALMGKLWVLADATEWPIRCGDLLTTSSTPGHARRVTARERAFGAVVGKALTALPSGQGLVRVLVSAT